MKIIKGHDYYDNAGYGIDPSIIFVRTRVDDVTVPKNLTQTICDTNAQYSYFYFDLRRIRPYYIIMAGSVYPMVKIDIGDIGYIKWQMCYDRDEALALAEKYHIRAQTAFSRVNYIADHFNNVSPDWSKWLIENKIVTGVVGQVGRTIKCSINIHNLSDYEFYRVVDAPTAHMEISRYVGGVLSNNPDTVKLSDKSKILKAGFDYSSSFRSSPTKHGVK